MHSPSSLGANPHCERDRRTMVCPTHSRVTTVARHTKQILSKSGFLLGVSSIWFSCHFHHTLAQPCGFQPSVCVCWGEEEGCISLPTTMMLLYSSLIFCLKEIRGLADCQAFFFFFFLTGLSKCSKCCQSNG